MSNPMYSPPPGGQPPYGVPSGPPVNGTLILVLGILSIVCLPILGPVALIMANNALKSGPIDPAQAGSVNAGRICGIIGCVLLVLGIIYGIILGVGIAHGISTHTPVSSPSAP